jgi:hypothetical protein
MKQAYLTLLVLIFIITNSLAQDSPTDEAAKLAQEAANPIASLISVPLMMTFNPSTGDYDRLFHSYTLQPVVPFRLSEKLNMVTRTIIPIVYKPDNAPSGGTFGLGNTTVSSFIVPPQKGIFTWGIGAALQIPTASSPELGGDAFGIGPSAVALVMPGKWVIGATVSQMWSYKTNDLNVMIAQYFITRNFNKGWYVNTLPIITANFNAPEDNVWTVPFGAGGGKIVHSTFTPMKFQLHAYYNVIKPEALSEYSIVAMIVMMFPHKKKPEIIK